MTLRQLCLVSILYLSFATMPRLVFAAETSAAQDELMSGYVKDGLHCEGNANYLGAIHAYTKATIEHPGDRYAWVHLAKSYRARNQIFQTAEDQLESQERERAIKVRWTYVRMRRAITLKYQYYRSRPNSGEFGVYYLRGDNNPVPPPPDDNRILQVEKFLCQPNCLDFYIRSVGYLKQYGQALHARRLIQEIANKKTRLDKEESWRALESAKTDTAALWLRLGLVCEQWHADEAEAALQVVLLSNPNKEQSDEARLGLARVWAASGPKGCARYLIAPEAN